MSSLRRVLGGGYPWMAAMFFGSVLLDVAYTSLLRDTGGAYLPSVFGEVPDFLLVLGAATVLAGLAAVALSWSTPRAGKLFLASLGVLSFEFIGPIVLFPLLGTSSNSTLPGISASIRLAPLGLASILALGGFLDLCRETLPAVPPILDPLA